MTNNTEIKPYERKISPLERMFLRAPYSIVTMTVRIKGSVTEEMLTSAVEKIQVRHTSLRVRIKVDEDQVPWFTSEGVKDIPIEIVPRESGDHWIQVFHEACRVPFEFDERPAIRFILVQSPKVSDLIIFCHHVICDGMSLAYLARDLMLHLGDPAREVEVLPDPVTIDLENIPEEVSLNSLVRFVINRMNKRWAAEAVFFDQEDYEILNKAYWEDNKHQMLIVELSEAETSALVDRCRKEGVTVNSALTAAFAGAQNFVQGDKASHSNVVVAGSLRDRLPRPAGEEMGFYAGAVSLKFKFDSETGFWNGVGKLHRKLKPLYTNKNLFRELILWCYLEPGIMESLSYKMLGGFVQPDAPRHQKISEFSKREDVISSMLKREKMDTLDHVLIGTAVTNLTRLDFPRNYGSLEMDRMIMNPGGAYPLSLVNLVVGAVTCAGKLSLLLEYSEKTVDTNTMEKIRDKALEFLLVE